MEGVAYRTEERSRTVVVPLKHSWRTKKQSRRCGALKANDFGEVNFSHCLGGHIYEETMRVARLTDTFFRLTDIRIALVICKRIDASSASQRRSN